MFIALVEKKIEYTIFFISYPPHTQPCKGVVVGWRQVRWCQAEVNASAKGCHRKCQCRGGGVECQEEGRHRQIRVLGATADKRDNGVR